MGEAVQQEALGVAVQPDGKIVAAGYTVRDGVIVVRYLPDGQLDDTFGTDGVAIVGIDGRANDVVVQDDGLIVVGRASPTGTARATTSTTSSSPGSSRAGGRIRASASARRSSPTSAG